MKKVDLKQIKKMNSGHFDYTCYYYYKKKLESH